MAKVWLSSNTEPCHFCGKIKRTEAMSLGPGTFMVCRKCAKNPEALFQTLHENLQAEHERQRKAQERKRKRKENACPNCGKQMNPEIVAMNDEQLRLPGIGTLNVVVRKCKCGESELVLPRLSCLIDWYVANEDLKKSIKREKQHEKGKREATCPAKTARRTTA